MTAEGWVWLGVFATGFWLGTFFYGGLWWTVARLPAVRRPAAWMLSSFMLRAGISLVGLYWLMAGDFKQLGLALGGWLLARMLLVKRLGKRNAV